MKLSWCVCVVWLAAGGVALAEGTELPPLPAELGGGEPPSGAPELPSLDAVTSPPPAEPPAAKSEKTPDPLSNLTPPTSSEEKKPAESGQDVAADASVEKLPPLPKPSQFAPASSETIAAQESTGSEQTSDAPPPLVLPNFDAPADAGDQGERKSAELTPEERRKKTIDFFEPGAQMKLDDEEDAPQEDVIEDKPEPKKRRVVAKLPLYRFNYKNQYLPPTIYKKQYDAMNTHLPLATYEQDYDYYTFLAAVTNNVDGLRSFLNKGRNPNMRSPAGETLAAAAARSGARDTLRLLLARGASPGSVPFSPGYHSNDMQTVAALMAKNPRW